MHELPAIEDRHLRFLLSKAFSAPLAKAPAPAGSSLINDRSRHDGF